jgi:hypothetical protein
MSTLKKHPILRKILVLSLLAVAGIVGGEIYQHFSKKTIDETLAHYQAKHLMTSTMRINGVNVIGKAWHLPHGISVDVLKDAKGRALVLPHKEGGHMVYTFDGDQPPEPTQRFYPDVLPHINGFECQYTIDFTTTRTYVMGSCAYSKDEMLQHTEDALRGSGWSFQPTSLSWVKGSAKLQTIFHSRDERCAGTFFLEIQQ